MYINPFLCGIITTILTELGAIFIYAIYWATKEENK